MFDNLPTVPESDRPRPLYLRHTPDAASAAIAAERGWIPTDVRLIKDPQEAIKATLEGARVGVIALNDEDLANLMAEAKVYGLLTAKKTEEESPNQDKAIQGEDDLDRILSFGKKDNKASQNKAEASAPSKTKKSKKGT